MSHTRGNQLFLAQKSAVHEFSSERGKEAGREEGRKEGRDEGSKEGTKEKRFL